MADKRCLETRPTRRGANVDEDSVTLRDERQRLDIAECFFMFYLF